MTNTIQLIGAVIALVIAAVFTFLLPGSGAEMVVVGIAGSIFSYLGYEWRTTYDEVKNWIASKTIWSTLLVGVPAIILLLSVLLSWDLCAIILIGFALCDIINWLIGLGGGLFIIGITHAKVKKGKKV